MHKLATGVTSGGASIAGNSKPSASLTRLITAQTGSGGCLGEPRLIRAVTLTEASESLVRSLACYSDFPYSLAGRFLVAFTSGRDVGSGVVLVQAVALSDRRQARVRGGHRPALGLHHMLQVTCSR